MAAQTIEERLEALENKVAHLMGEQVEEKKPVPWWEQWAGAFKDDPLFDEAMRLGAEYRRSQPTAEEEYDALYGMGKGDNDAPA